MNYIETHTHSTLFDLTQIEPCDILTLNTYKTTVQHQYLHAELHVFGIIDHVDDSIMNELTIYNNHRLNLSRHICPIHNRSIQFHLFGYV